MITAEFFNQLLLQPALLSKTSTDDLQQLTEQFPFFAPAHFLLAVKKKQTNSTEAHAQLQKAAVYFHQPLWFNYQLQQFSEDEKPVLTVELTEKQNNILLQTAEENVNEKTIADTDSLLNAEATINAEQLIEEDILITEAEAEQNANAIIEAAEIKEVLLNPSAQISNEKPVFTFEPYHTVDYFASMGIKLQEEKLENDQLGQQVKSFTQWLRSMKKIYVEEKQELDAVHEQEVVNKAKESNQQTEVITETMAGVFIKQGKLSSARELYYKLSLLHPEKSAYFASRIEELKL